MSAQPHYRPEPESPKRLAVLEAATMLFMAHGYGAVSMDAIARAAGVSKATLYAYFASKDSLFADIMGEGCRAKIDAMDDLLQASVTGPADLRAVLGEFGTRMISFLMSSRTLAIYRIVVSESARFPELGETFYEHGPRSFRRIFSQWLADQMQAGWLRRTDPDLAAEHYISLLRGSLFLRASLGLPTDHEPAALAEHATAVADTFLRAFGAEEARPPLSP